MKAQRGTRAIAATALASLLLSGFATPARADDGDPFEGFNRGIWWFDDGLDRYFLEPIAVGWRWITPQSLRAGLRNAFDNLRFPLRFVNHLLQADVQQAGREVGRFAINSTLGVAGLWDPASRYGLELRDEDFGQTLAVWGVPPGAFLMLPVFGPSGVRDTAALPLDLALGAWPSLISPTTGIAINVTERINTRARLIDDVRELRAASLDYYVAVRNAYRQLRVARVQNGEVPDEETSDDLYELYEEGDE